MGYSLETDDCKTNWGCCWVKKILTRGPAFRFKPPKLNDDEKEIAINRTVTSMTIKIRMSLIERTVYPKPRTQTQTWEIDKGLRIGAHKWYIIPQSTTLQEMKDTLMVEIGRGFEVEMRGERPETDKGGRKKIKKKKVV